MAKGSPMMSARLGVFGAAVSALLIYGFSSSPAANAPQVGKDAAAMAPARLDNFLLVDTNFEAHELYRMSESKAVVLVTQSNSDAVVRGQADALKALKTAYAGKGVQFMLLNSSLKDSREAILAESAKAGYDTPVLMDSYQLVGESLGVTRSAEVIVIDPKTWGVAYRGALSDPATAKDATVWLAVIQKTADVTIEQGENRGKTLTYTNVVRELTPVGTWTGQPLRIQLARSALMRRELETVAILIQQGKAGPIIAAAMTGLW